MRRPQQKYSQCALVLIGLVVRGAAQESGWQQNQANATMCQWQLPRVGVIRDTAYIDGGFLYWQPGFTDGTAGAPTSDGNPLGLVYTLNFSTPFNTSSNMSQILKTISKAPNGAAANNIGPQFYDGAMLANDNEFFTYGGLLSLTDAYAPTAANEVLGYQEYASGPPKQFFSGFINDDLPAGMTRFITGGAAVSVPSENKGFYFGGLRSAGYGPIYYTSANETLNADVLSNTLVSVDLSTQGREVWTNQTLPSTVPGRANAELVFVPVSTSGVLIAIGGVINPVGATIVQGLNSTQQTQSQQTNPTFMSSVSIYDIASQTWYNQSTFGSGPSGLTQGCTVVASAPDGSSHNIYWYGGFDGIDLTSTFSDDVWVLSVPSFTWIKVTSGVSSHGRAGHRCVKPYPDQMLIIGGYTTLSGILPTCVTDNIILNYNLSSNQWLDSYSPLVWSNYTVPASIFKQIGGNGNGGASSLSPSTWSNQSLQKIFSTSYDTSKIKNWYPYKLDAGNNTTNPPPAPIIITKKQSLPTYAIAIICVVAGLVFITVCFIAYRIYSKRRRPQQNQSPSEDGTHDIHRSRIMAWMRSSSVSGESKAVGTTTVAVSEFDDSTVMSPTDRQTFHEMANDTVKPESQNVSQVRVTEMNEAGGDTIHEMMDSSHLAELPDTSIPEPAEIGSPVSVVSP
ncbi:hypothetical protein BP6252_06845 [Coleophoma cylindrospora]|uniref:Kelch repeat protein n=1 Tax=Coleophoma cylindrospora TaxID=1849047 RepID=A0A3D8RG78_9HELO|nr:hypothetical protein BP6252_06845 [Coleophoma cylindrospora]